MSAIPESNNPIDGRILCENLLHTEVEDEVIRILDDAGYSLENESVWVPLGNNPGNFSTVGNQQEEGTSALVEKIINSGDAVLMSLCQSQNIIPDSDSAPESMAEAVEQFLGIKDGRLDNLSPRERTELAENNIHLVVTGGKLSPCYSIVDSGEGQTPNSFPQTFLSTTQSSPKIKIPFVQGKFNAGGTGSLQFCGKHNIQLIISRRQPTCPVEEGDDSADLWGFTIVRRRRPTHGDRSSVFQYLAPGGKVPRFKADSLNLLPTKSSKNKPGEPYTSHMNYGTCVKLYNYRWPGKGLATIEARRELETFLQIPCLPFRIHETRKAFKANYFATTVIGVWNEIGTDEENATNKIEEGFPAYDTVSLPDIGTLPMRIVVWNESVKPRNVTTGVYFLVNGQVHGSYQKDFISRKLGFDYIKDHLLVAIDCTEMDRGVAEDLFMASRDRLRKNEEYTEIRNMIGEELKSHPGLKQTEAIWRQRAREKAIEAKDDVKDIFNELMKIDPNLAKILGFGGQIHGGVGPGTPTKYEGKKFPTFFRLCKEPSEGLVRSVPLNGTTRIEFETDAENNYFSRPDEPGELSVEPSIDLIESSRLWNGKFSVKFRVPWDAKVGDEISVSLSVSDVMTISKGPFVSNFKLIASEAVTKKPKPPSPNPIPPVPSPDNPNNDDTAFSIPEVMEVRKAEWERHGFKNNEEALKIKRADRGYDFYLNIDNKYLINEMSSQKYDPEVTKMLFKWGIAISAIGMITEQKDHGSNNNEDEEIGVDLEVISKACDGLCRVILTIIRKLPELPLNKLE